MERKLIRNVNMDLETREFDALTKSITDAVTAFGGYIQQSDVSGNSLNWSGDRSSRYSTITARIPSDKLDAFLTEVSSQGNVTYKNESVQDVTLQYTDITSRKKTLQMEQERLWALLEKAESVDAVLALNPAFPKSATSWNPWSPSFAPWITRSCTVPFTSPSRKSRFSPPLTRIPFWSASRKDSAAV